MILSMEVRYLHHYLIYTHVPEEVWEGFPCSVVTASLRLFFVAARSEYIRLRSKAGPA